MAAQTQATGKRVFKTVKKLSKGGGDRTFRKWNDWVEDDNFVGKFIDSYTDTYGNPAWVFTVLDAEFSDKKLAKSLIDKNLVCNSAGQLNKAMDGLEEGSLVRITYGGKKEMTGGKFAGKDSHLVAVESVSDDDSEDESTDDDSYAQNLDEDDL